MKKTHETRWVIYTEHEDSIWEAEYLGDIPPITGELAKEIVAQRRKLLPEPIRLVMHMPKDFGLFSKEARAYFAGREGTQGIIASAIIVDGFISWGLMKFLSIIQPSTFPVETFRDIEKAKKWLIKQNPGSSEMPFGHFAQA